MSKGIAYRWWFITYNNPPEDWKTALTDIKARYVIGQLEQGENGTRHIQALLYFDEKKRSSAFKGMPFWCKGISKEDAVIRVSKYCSKSETRLEGPFESGDKPVSVSKKRDWEAAKKLAKEGRLEEIEGSIYIPYYSNLSKIAYQSHVAFTSEKVRGLWVFGEPGTGKSHYARTKFGENFYLKAQNKWWDGYCGNEVVVLEDLDKSGACLGHYIKIWADKWSCSGEIKGGMVGLSHKVLLITSNYLPADLWPEDNTLCQAIQRRFYFVIFTAYSKYVEYLDEPGQFKLDGFGLNTFIDL